MLWCQIINNNRRFAQLRIKWLTCTLFCSLSVFLVILVTLAPAQAGNSLESKRGYWDFDGGADIFFTRSGANITFSVYNKSTDDSYRCKGCAAGCATALMDWEVWGTDGGMLDSGQVRFQDVCNGGAAHKRKKLRSIPSKYNVLEARWNITTPNGGHSFEKNRQFYERP